MTKFSICIALLLAALLCGSALASEAEYVDREKLFDFRPGSEYDATDLFENFKGVLPGDVLEEKITVKNSSDGQVRIYLQCRQDAYVTTDAQDFLSQLALTVKSGDTEIFEAAADEKDGLAKKKLLGTFKKNGSVELTVTLEVPTDLGSEYMGQIGVVPWTFAVEEIPEDETPETGDWFRMGIWAGAAALIVAAIIVLIIAQRRRSSEEN